MKAVTVAGGSSDDPEIEHGTAVPEGEPDPEPTADAKAGAGAGAQDSAEANARAEAEAKAGVERQAGTEAGAEPEPTAGAEAETEAQAGVTAGAGADLKADSEGPEADAAAKPTRQAAPEVGAEVEAGAEPEAEATAAPKSARGGAAAPASVNQAAPEANAEIDDEAEPKVKAEAGAEATADGPAAAGPASQAAPEADAVAKPVTAGKFDAEAAAKPTDQAAHEVDAKAEAGAEPEAEATAAPKSARGGAAAPGLVSQAAPEADTDGKASPRGEARAGSEADAAARAGREAGAEARAGVGSKGRAAGAAAGGPASRAAREADGVVTPVAEAKVGAEASAEGEGEAKAGPEVAAGRGGGTGPAKQAAPEAEAAAGRGGVAGDDAGGAAAVEGGAGGGSAPAAGADVTQVLVVPKSPRGDGAPKVPSWARQGEAEADSERTSQFVALKPLDVAPPAAPAAPEAAPRVRPQPPVAGAPLPPLDLLAELTNPTPPPETPRRTTVRRVKVWTPILLLLAGAYVGAQMLRPLPAPQMVSAETTRTVDGQFSIPWPAKGQGAVRVAGSGDIGTFGEQKPVPTASVAKVMTAYVILKGHPLRKTDPGPDITVDAKTVADGNSEHESRISGLTAGQKFSQQDMLKMLMIPSGNNVARLLARWDTGTDSEAAFVEKMNAAAKELGMTSTTYTDPSGLDAGTVSTATDQLKLAEAVMKDDTFRAIVALPSATIKGLGQPLSNNNVLLTAQGVSVRGIKTGSSTPAGGALMWAAYKSVGDKDQLILGTLMDQRVDGPDPDATNSLALVQANSKKIIEAVRGALASAPVIRKGQQVGYLDDGLGGRMPLVATKDLNVIGVPGQQLKLSLVPGASPLPHSAKAGSEVATLTVGEGEGAKSVPVAVEKDMAEPSFGTRMTRMR
ncbi:serine hydrolase [Streptomyces sp. NPDC048357]|uniref:D-alanyl-D-alanine carboxypeptidase n=1 Tax=Streptomyces sp. NPDC048357 TaxID=3154719 RepID=UPI00342BA4D4